MKCLDGLFFLASQWDHQKESLKRQEMFIHLVLRDLTNLSETTDRIDQQTVQNVQNVPFTQDVLSDHQWTVQNVPLIQDVLSDLVEWKDLSRQTGKGLMAGEQLPQNNVDRLSVEV